MPQVNRPIKSTELLRTSRAALPRDDLKMAFAGKENKGPQGHAKSTLHSTNVKSRSTKQSKYKTPKR